MRLIRNAIIFKAELPPRDELEQRLATRAFEPVLESMTFSQGFIPSALTNQLVSDFPGGYCFTLRLDEKVLPYEAVRSAIDKAYQAYLESNPDVGEDAFMEISEKVRMDLISKALTTTRTTTAYYHEADQFLIVPVTSKPVADRLLGQVIQACESVRTTTINVSSVTSGLTGRLRRYLVEGEDPEKAFAPFNLGECCKLKGEEGRVSFDMSNLSHAEQGLREMLERNMEVESLELVNEGTSFTLTNNFRLRRIDFMGELTKEEQAEHDELDGVALWQSEASAQVLQVCAIVRQLCEMFEYQPMLPEPEPAPEEPGQAA